MFLSFSECVSELNEWLFVVVVVVVVRFVVFVSTVKEDNVCGIEDAEEEDEIGGVKIDELFGIRRGGGIPAEGVSGGCLRSKS